MQSGWHHAAGSVKLATSNKDCSVFTVMGGGVKLLRIPIGPNQTLAALVPGCVTLDMRKGVASVYCLK